MMNNIIEILKRWCLEQNSLNSYELYYQNIEKSDIILKFYSKTLNDQKMYIFYPNENLNYVKFNSFINCYLLTDVLSEIRINNINKILNE